MTAKKQTAKRKTAPRKKAEKKEPTKIGGPILYSTEAIIEALQQNHGLVYITAKTLGCSPVTIYERAKSEPCIQEAINSQRGEFVDIAENKLWDKVENGTLDAVKFVLRTLGRNRDYVERVETRIGGDASAPAIKTESTPAITLEELPLDVKKAILDAIRKKKSDSEANKS